MLDKEGIGKSESLALKKRAPWYMYSRLLHLLLFCVSQSDITLLHKSTLLGRRSNFYPVLSTQSNVHVSCLFYSPKHTNYLSRELQDLLQLPAWQLKLPCFLLCFSELAVGKELLHGAELFLRR